MANVVPGSQSLLIAPAAVMAWLLSLWVFGIAGVRFPDGAARGRFAAAVARSASPDPYPVPAPFARTRPSRRFPARAARDVPEGEEVADDAPIPEPMPGTAAGDHERAVASDWAAGAELGDGRTLGRSGRKARPRLSLPAVLRRSEQQPDLGPGPLAAFLAEHPVAADGESAAADDIDLRERQSEASPYAGGA